MVSLRVVPAAGGLRQGQVVEVRHGEHVAMVVLAPEAPADRALRVVVHCQDIVPAVDPDVRAGERLDHG